MCSDATRTCDLVSDDGWKLFYDRSHYSLEGARYFGRRMAELGWFNGPPDNLEATVVGR